MGIDHRRSHILVAQKLLHRADVVAGLQEVGEEGRDFGSAYLFRVPLIVEEDEAFNPVDIGFFGAEGVMLAADGIAHLVEECPGAFPRALILGLILER